MKLNKNLMQSSNNIASKNPDRINELEFRLGLLSEHVTPEQLAFLEPTAKRLKQTLKTKQSYDLVKHVCSNDGLALAYVAKRLITEELCEIAVTQNGLALMYVPPVFINDHLCEIAVLNNGLALEYVPENMRTFSMAENAVSYYLSDDRYMPMTKKIEIARERGAELKNRSYPIAFVPSPMITKDLILKAVSYSGFCLKNIKKNCVSGKIVKEAISNNGFAIKYVPQRFITKDVIEQAIMEQPLAIEYIPSEYITQDLGKRAFNGNHIAFSYIPDEFITEEMCISIIQNKEVYIDKEVAWFDTHEEGIPFSDIPESMRNDRKILNLIIENIDNALDDLLQWNRHNILEIKDPDCLNPENNRGNEIKPLNRSTVDYLKNCCDTQDKVEFDSSPLGNRIKKYLEYSDSYDDDSKYVSGVEGEYITIKKNPDGINIYDFSDGDNTTNVYYYISDIHIEHQVLSKHKDSLIKVHSEKDRERLFSEKLEMKIDEMLRGKDMRKAILLIGGDVASSQEISAEFYRILRAKCEGLIISVLGNHELWDGTSIREWSNPDYQARSCEIIVEDYKEAIEYTEEYTYADSQEFRSILLENEVYVLYKNCTSCVISEKEIIESNDSDLSDVFSKSSVIVLGGIGYSGLNPLHNAETGIYKKTVKSMQDDYYRSKRFKVIYDKVNKCAHDRKVIVLTHNPIHDWTNDPCNPNWIYINGHTHKNTIRHEEDGTTVLADNQIGYRPRKWSLNSFKIDNWYDPFEKYEDGIYEIKPEEYRDFNFGRGILTTGCNYQGTIYALKCAGKYMFLLKTEKQLYLLIGGVRKKITKTIQYYYDNMGLYVQGINRIFTPHRRVLKQLSEEVKKSGGTGIIHGSIVDVSFLSHIYLNPHDGTITPYWAMDISSRIPYKSYERLLFEKEPQLYDNYLLACKKNTISLLVNRMESGNQGVEPVTIPDWVYGTEMYQPSMVMRSAQYIWEKNVIRIWNDKVLEVVTPVNDENLKEGLIARNEK